MAIPPISPLVSCSVCPNFFATACNTPTAALVTSAPIPSPGKIKIFRFIVRLGSFGRSTSASGFGFFDYFARDGVDFVVPHAFLAIGHGGETLIHQVKLLAVQSEAQVLAALGERVPSAVLAQHQAALRHAHTLWFDDFVGGAFLEKTVLMDAGFLGEGVFADDSLICLRPEGDDGTEQLACRGQVFGYDL